MKVINGVNWQILLGFMGLFCSVTGCGGSGSAGQNQNTDADVIALCSGYADVDGDGYGDAAVSSESGCDVGVPQYVADASDCDDTSSSIHPGVEEVVDDGIDQDCDGSDLASADLADENGGGEADPALQEPAEDPALVAGDPAPATTTSHPLYFFLLVHTGEDGCGFENYDPTDPTEVARYEDCRDGLRDVSARLGTMGVKAVFQFHGGFLQRLITEEIVARLRNDADPSFDFARDIAAYGHEIGFHHHSECLAALDPEACVALGEGDEWGTSGTPGSDEAKEPSSDYQLNLRLASLFYVVDESEISVENYFSTETPEIKSYCGWGATYRIGVDMAAGSTDEADVIASTGIEILTSNNEFFVDWDESSCFTGRESADGDNLKAVPHPVILPTSAGKLVYYASPNPLFGSATFDLDANLEAFSGHLACAAERTAGAAYGGEIFTWSGTTHLHNMIEDADANGIPDGITHVEAYLAGLNGEVAASGTFSEIKLMTLQEIEAERVASEAAGADYGFEITPEASAEDPVTGPAPVPLPVSDGRPIVPGQGELTPIPTERFW